MAGSSSVMAVQLNGASR